MLLKSSDILNLKTRNKYKILIAMDLIKMLINGNSVILTK